MSGYIFILIFVVIFVNNLNSQTKSPKGATKAEMGFIEKVIVEENFASLFYSFDSNYYAMFISDISKPDARITIKERIVLNNDTMTFPALRPRDKVGRLVCTSFESKHGTFAFDGLLSQKDYYLHLYKPISESNDTFKLVKTFAFNTIAKKPKFSANQISFEDVTDTSFVILFVNGDGEGRIVVVATTEQLPTPENGKDYKPSSIFGKEFSRIGKGFVVYDGNEQRPKVRITNLSPGKRYVVGVFEYNGSGKYRNYLLIPSSTNPRKRATLLSTPKILGVENVTTEGCNFQWKKVEGASTYIIDVALDKDFKELVEPYINLDVGGIGEFELSDLKPKTKYYIRLKAKGEAGESQFSPPFEFKTK